MSSAAVATKHPTWIRNGLISTIIWTLWATIAQPEWTGVLLMLSPFVLLPLGLRLAATADTGPVADELLTLARAAPVIALTAAISFVPGPGVLAAALTIPWLVFTVVVALAGAGRLLSRQTLNDPGIGADAGLIFLVVGGAWLTISRAGLNPLGFSDAIVQLTAVHFHYAGFALPIVAAVAASRLGLSAAVPVAVIIGVPLTAIGITAGGALEWVAATFMALAGIATAIVLLRLSTDTLGTPRALIAAAGFALIGGMAMALGWACSMRFTFNFPGLASMAAIHGSLNALGFGLLGLIGLNLVAPASNDNAARTSLHLARPSAQTLTRLAKQAADHGPTNPVGLLKRAVPAGFKHQVWTLPIEHQDFAQARNAINQWNGHQAAGINRMPEQPDIAVGQTLALAIPVGPISVSATSRIVEVVDEPDRYGFTYATLPHHPVDGEESFIITRNLDGSLTITVTITVTATWQAATLANNVCPPVTRFLQNRAINQYLRGIAET